MSASSYQSYSFSDEGVDVPVGPMTEDSSHEGALPSAHSQTEVDANSASDLEEEEYVTFLMNSLDEDREGPDMMSTSSEGAPTSPGSCASWHNATAPEGALRCIAVCLSRRAGEAALCVQALDRVTPSVPSMTMTSLSMTSYPGLGNGRRLASTRADAMQH